MPGTAHLRLARYMEQANFTCGNFNPDLSESAYTGMQLAPSKVIKSPRIATAAFSMECVLHDIYQLVGEKGDVTTNVVIGRVVGFHVKNAVYNKESNRIDLAKYKPVGRLGGVGGFSSAGLDQSWSADPFFVPGTGFVALEQSILG